MEFYTYLWLREDGTPYYVGKGHGARAFQTKDHNVKCPKDLSRIIVQPQPSEEAAFAVERFFIEFYGRQDVGTGCLRNRTAGGEGCTGGKWTAEQKKRHSDIKKLAVFSDEHRKHLSQAQMGKHPSEETRKKQSESAKRRFQNPEQRKLAGKAGKKGAASRWRKQ
jgi:hypothetical protein